MAKKGTTRKNSKSEVLDVNSPSKIPALEKLLKSGKITIVLVYADWCGHCHKFKKDVWGPMCKNGAKNNRVALNETMMGNTSLKDVKIPGYPAVIAVGEKGVPASFTTEKGEVTNAMPTPATPEEMTKVVNATPKQTISETTTTNSKTLPFLNTSVTPPFITNQSKSTAPQGEVFEPSPMTAPQGVKGGGNLMRILEGGAMPEQVLSALHRLMKGGKRRSKTKTKKVRRRRFIRA